MIKQRKPLHSRYFRVFEAKPVKTLYNRAFSSVSPLKEPVPNPTPEEFQEKINAKLTEILPQFKTDEGKCAVESYLAAMNVIAKHKLGLELLKFFQQYSFSNYVALKRVDTKLSELEKVDLKSYKNVLPHVENDYENYVKLAPIIKLPQSKVEPDNFARLLHFIAIHNKHSGMYRKFQRFLQTLKGWHDNYQAVVDLRERYNAAEYSRPRRFNQDIPGLKLYETYQEWCERG